MMRRKREDRGADDSVEIDLLLDVVENIKNSITKIEGRLAKIEEILERG